MSHPVTRWCAALLPIAALACGCSLTPQERSLDPTGVDASVVGVEPEASLAVPRSETTGPEFYPLAIGNRWHYRRQFTIVEHADSNDPTVTRYHSTIESLQMCTQVRGTRSYVVEQHTEYGPGAAIAYWIYFRQDRQGLYEFDDTGQPQCADAAVAAATTERAGVIASGAAPPRGAAIASESGVARIVEPGTAAAELVHRLTMVRAALGLDARPRGNSALSGPDAGELVRLDYPLHRGAHWVIRADPRFECTVEGIDQIRAGRRNLVGYRIRIDNQFLGPHDTAHVWYGRQGFLRLTAHFEGEGTDDEGNPTGLLLVDDDQILDDYELVGGP